MKTLGIVGGVGPYAGVDLVSKILDGTKVNRDQEHLPIILASLPHKIGDRKEFLLHGGVNPGVALGEIMCSLVRAGAEVLGMPCNTAHSKRILDVALAKLAEETGQPKQSGQGQIKFLHMIDEVILEIKTQWPTAKRIGVLCTVGTYVTNIYQDALQPVQLQPLFLEEAGRNLAQDAISHPEFGIKACMPVSERAKQILHQAAENLVRQGAEVIILGCTELPMALTQAEILGVPLLDTTAVLAKALHRECLS